MTLFMAVTADEYELPLIVSDSRKGIADYAGITTDGISSSISKNRTGKTRGFKFVKVEIEEDEVKVKHGKAPTVKQKKLISAHGLRHENWLVERDTNTEMVIVSRSGKSKRTLMKG